MSAPHRTQAYSGLGAGGRAFAVHRAAALARFRAESLLMVCLPRRSRGQMRSREPAIAPPTNATAGLFVFCISARASSSEMTGSGGPPPLSLPPALGSVGLSGRLR